MGKAGGIIGIIAGVFGFIAAIVTVLFGGFAGAVKAEGADTVIGLGFGGILFSFLVIVSSSIAMGRPRGGGIATILLSIAGAILGGTPVAVCMTLAFLGGVVAMFGKSKPKEAVSN
ncbi:MAG: hypothetical protein VKO21_10965 [Candidatus Sericytochromatia bacterium]|nr:hypothetical protein [Candidatus Sericytochromatia bacterium]